MKNIDQTSVRTALRLAGALVIIAGITVVSHDPHSAVNYMERRMGKGFLRWNSADDTLKVYDGPTTAAALLNTETRSTSGTYTDWTPS